MPSLAIQVGGAEFFDGELLAADNCQCKSSFDEDIRDNDDRREHCIATFIAESVVGKPARLVTSDLNQT